MIDIRKLNIIDVEAIILDNCTYCAESHQLMLEELLNEYNFDETIKTIAQKFNIIINDENYKELGEIITDILTDNFYNNTHIFLILNIYSKCMNNTHTMSFKVCFTDLYTQNEEDLILVNVSETSVSVVLFNVLEYINQYGTIINIERLYEDINAFSSLNNWLNNTYIPKWRNTLSETEFWTQVFLHIKNRCYIFNMSHDYTHSYYNDNGYIKIY